MARLKDYNLSMHRHFLDKKYIAHEKKGRANERRILKHS